MQFFPTILLADDNFDDKVFLRDAFDFIGAKVNLLLFDNGIDAIDYLQSCSAYNLPDLIILDYSMPKMNGFEIWKCINNQEALKHIPKVILSSGKFSPFAASYDIDTKSFFVKPGNIFDFKKLALDLLKIIKTQESYH